MGRGGRYWVPHVPTMMGQFLGMGGGVTKGKALQQDTPIWGSEVGLPHLGGSSPHPTWLPRSLSGAPSIRDGDLGVSKQLHAQEAPGGPEDAVVWPGRRDEPSRRGQGLGDKELTTEVLSVLGSTGNTCRDLEANRAPQAVGKRRFRET